MWRTSSKIVYLFFKLTILVYELIIFIGKTFSCCQYKLTVVILATRIWQVSLLSSSCHQAAVLLAEFTCIIYLVQELFDRFWSPLQFVFFQSTFLIGNCSTSINILIYVSSINTTSINITSINITSINIPTINTTAVNSSTINMTWINTPVLQSTLPQSSTFIKNIYHSTTCYYHAEFKLNYLQNYNFYQYNLNFGNFNIELIININLINNNIIYYLYNMDLYLFQGSKFAVWKCN